MEPTEATQWVDACILVLNQSMNLGAKIYPFIAALGALRVIFESI